MIYPKYDSKINYFELCVEYETLQHSNKNKEYYYWCEVLKVMEEYDCVKNTEEGINYHWYQWNNGNLYTASKKKLFKEIQSEFQKLNISSIDRDNMWAFITINFNPQEITPRKQLEISQKLLQMKYWTSCEMVLEKHRENGLHHHTHFLIKTDDKSIYYTSKIVDKIFQILSGKRNSKLVLNKAFIDVLGPCNKKKDFQPFQVYYEYIRGNKREEKLKYVALDDSWRQINNIEKIYIKE